MQKNPPSGAGGPCDFQAVYNRAERYIEARYGVVVRIGDVIDPNTGDFDGESIKLDYDQELEMALFVLIHLFGHTVQWNLSESLRHLGLTSANVRQPSDEELQRIWSYEREATRYGLMLMREAGVASAGLERWASDCWHADWAFLSHLYCTGERLDPMTLLRPGEGELLLPLAIPDFSPQRYMSRWSF